jgi:hypothetical protein
VKDERVLAASDQISYHSKRRTVDTTLFPALAPSDGLFFKSAIRNPKSTIGTPPAVYTVHHMRVPQTRPPANASKSTHHASGHIVAIASLENQQSAASNREG